MIGDNQTNDSDCGSIDTSATYKGHNFVDRSRTYECDSESSGINAVVGPMNTRLSLEAIRQDELRSQVVVDAFNQFILQAGNIYKGEKLSTPDAIRLRAAANNVGLTNNVVDALLEQLSDRNAMMEYCMTSDGVFAKKIKEDPKLSRVLLESNDFSQEKSDGLNLSNSILRLFIHKTIKQFLNEQNLELSDIIEKSHRTQLYNEPLAHNNEDETIPENSGSPRNYSEERKHIFITEEEAKLARVNASASTVKVQNFRNASLYDIFTESSMHSHHNPVQRKQLNILHIPESRDDDLRMVPCSTEQESSIVPRLETNEVAPFRLDIINNPVETPGTGANDSSLIQNEIFSSPNNNLPRTSITSVKCETSSVLNFNQEICEENLTTPVSTPERKLLPTTMKNTQMNETSAIKQRIAMYEAGTISPQPPKAYSPQTNNEILNQKTFSSNKIKETRAIFEKKYHENEVVLEPYQKRQCKNMQEAIATWTQKEYQENEVTLEPYQKRQCKNMQEAIATWTQKEKENRTPSPINCGNNVMDKKDMKTAANKKCVEHLTTIQNQASLFQDENDGQCYTKLRHRQDNDPIALGNLLRVDESQCGVEYPSETETGRIKSLTSNSYDSKYILTCKPVEKRNETKMYVVDLDDKNSIREKNGAKDQFESYFSDENKDKNQDSDRAMDREFGNNQPHLIDYEAERYEREDQPRTKMSQTAKYHSHGTVSSKITTPSSIKYNHDKKFFNQRQFTMIDNDLHSFPAYIGSISDDSNKIPVPPLVLGSTSKQKSTEHYSGEPSISHENNQMTEPHTTSEDTCDINEISDENVWAEFESKISFHSESYHHKKIRDTLEYDDENDTDHFRGVQSKVVESSNNADYYVNHNPVDHITWTNFESKNMFRQRCEGSPSHNYSKSLESVTKLSQDKTLSQQTHVMNAPRNLSDYESSRNNKYYSTLQSTSNENSTIKPSIISPAADVSQKLPRALDATNFCQSTSNPNSKLSCDKKPTNGWISDQQIEMKSSIFESKTDQSCQDFFSKKEDHGRSKQSKSESKHILSFGCLPNEENQKIESETKDYFSNLLWSESQFSEYGAASSLEEENLDDRLHKSEHGIVSVREITHISSTDRDEIGDNDTHFREGHDRQPENYSLRNHSNSNNDYGALDEYNPTKPSISNEFQSPARRIPEGRIETKIGKSNKSAPTSRTVDELSSLNIKAEKMAYLEVNEFSEKYEDETFDEEQLNSQVRNCILTCDDKGKTESSLKPRSVNGRSMKTGSDLKKLASDMSETKLGHTFNGGVTVEVQTLNSTSEVSWPVDDVEINERRCHSFDKSANSVVDPDANSVAVDDLGSFSENILVQATSYDTHSKSITDVKKQMSHHMDSGSSENPYQHRLGPIVRILDRPLLDLDDEECLDAIEVERQNSNQSFSLQPNVQPHHASDTQTYRLDPPDLLPDPSPKGDRRMIDATPRLNNKTEAPEGATKEELNLLNQFIDVASTNFGGNTLSKESESRVRTAASKVGLTSKFVDQLLNQTMKKKEDSDSFLTFTTPNQRTNSYELQQSSFSNQENKHNIQSHSFHEHGLSSFARNDYGGENETINTDDCYRPTRKNGTRYENTTANCNIWESVGKNIGIIANLTARVCGVKYGGGRDDDSSVVSAISWEDDINRSSKAGKRQSRRPRDENNGSEDQDHSYHNRTQHVSFATPLNQAGDDPPRAKITQLV